jgi:hypothetical protein
MLKNASKRILPCFIGPPGAASFVIAEIGQDLGILLLYGQKIVTGGAIVRD